MSRDTQCKQLPFLLPSSVPVPCPPRRRQNQGVRLETLPLYLPQGREGGRKGGGWASSSWFPVKLSSRTRRRLGRPHRAGTLYPVLTSLRLLRALTGTQQALCFFPKLFTAHLSGDARWPFSAKGGGPSPVGGRQGRRIRPTLSAGLSPARLAP